MTRVLVLGGGPDAEREISIASASGVHQGCLEAGLEASLEIVDMPSIDEIRSWGGDVIFPVLHGKFGEGGEMQRRLESAGVRFVGTRSAGAALAMDKLATKLTASRLDISTPAACVLDGAHLLSTGNAWSPIDLPFVVKPVQDGSSVGLHICKSEADWVQAQAQICVDIEQHPQRVYMIEAFTPGRELTASVIADPDAPGRLRVLPLIEIAPRQGVYDFEAKYERSDTVYTVKPEIGEGITASIQSQALRICEELGVHHLARADFILRPDGTWVMLEVNTMPGFTATSLLPKAAGAIGLNMPMLCEHLVRCAERETSAITTPAG
jgi:D-alanine-D-alanine ligase